jgi:hypothetical protein
MHSSRYTYRTDHWMERNFPIEKFQRHGKSDNRHKNSYDKPCITQKGFSQFILRHFLALKFSY